jgi:hypothetical protein
LRVRDSKIKTKKTCQKNKNLLSYHHERKNQTLGCSRKSQWRMDQHL